MATCSIPVLLNGRPGVIAATGGRVHSLMAFEIIDGRITGLDVLADPVRLERLDLSQVPLS